MELKTTQCQPCGKGAEPVSADAAVRHLEQLPEWRIQSTNGEERLTRTFPFKRYQSCLDFAQAIGALAEEENHHPLMEVAWGAVTVSWWTHSIGGLHLNDFIMAARTDALFERGF